MHLPSISELLKEERYEGVRLKFLVAACLHAAQASLSHELFCDFIWACLKDGVMLEFDASGQGMDDLCSGFRARIGVSS